jgi:acetyl esterase/lipase/2-keto-4-pentenoate hydratase
MNLQSVFFAVAFSAGLNAGVAAHRAPDEVLTLWPGDAPGVSQARGPEHKVEGRPRPFFQITDIASPTLEMYLAPADKRNGAAVLVCPGGGLQRLAYEHEGLEVAEWLNSVGLTACVLKYRVPAPAQTGLIDAQRAMGLFRANAAKWQIDPKSIGFIGFSAGGEIGAWLITHSKERAYDAVDRFDQQSCRPDFAGLIYSGGLLQMGGVGGLKVGIATNLNNSTPPVFIAHAFDDASENSLQLALALKRAHVPTEFHLYHEGAHGFGARETGLPVGGWKQRFVAWLGALGHLDAMQVRSFSAEISAALSTGNTPVSFATKWPNGTLADAYAIQRRVVQAQSDVAMAGYTGAGTAAAGNDAPLTGVLFKNGRLEAAPDLKIERSVNERIVIKPGIGYVMGVDFSFEIPTDAHARDAVAAIVPVVELPRSIHSPGQAADPRDLVSANLGCARYIVGQRFAPGATAQRAWKSSLRRDGALLNETTVESPEGRQWHELRIILNQLTAQGHVIREGDLIICGGPGKRQPGEAGKYEARFGDLGKISFEVR